MQGRGEGRRGEGRGEEGMREGRERGNGKEREGESDYRIFQTFIILEVQFARLQE